MKTLPLRLMRALCALTLIGGLLGPLPARAQVVPEQPGALEAAGGYLVRAVTEADPADGGRVAVDGVAAFDPDGGTGVFEPGTTAAEVFDYGGVDKESGELLDVVRAAPGSHPSGSFVQAVGSSSPSPGPSGSPSPRPKPRKRPSSRPPAPTQGAPHPATPGPSSDDAAPPLGGGIGNAEEQAPPPRSFSTDRLVAAALRLRGLGWSDKWARVVYSPFPVAGEASFMDTWGALRYGPAPGEVRGHEGQDIFCDAGAPLLAVTGGRIEFDTNPLGGRVARLHMRDGSYWYYAHLMRWNRREFHSGEHVDPGDVIGYCGRSGNARTTPHHLHFGWYARNGEARNPMRALVGWLRSAEADARILVRKVEKRAARRSALQMLGRMFGDSWAPDLASVAPAPQASSAPPPSPSASPSQACDPGAIQVATAGEPVPCAPADAGLTPPSPGT